MDSLDATTRSASDSIAVDRSGPQRPAIDLEPVTDARRFVFALG